MTATAFRIGANWRWSTMTATLTSSTRPVDA